MSLRHFLSSDATYLTDLKKDNTRGIYVIKQKGLQGPLTINGKQFDASRCYRIGSAGGGKTACRVTSNSGKSTEFSSGLRNRVRFYLSNWITDGEIFAFLEMPPPKFFASRESSDTRYEKVNKRKWNQTRVVEDLIHKNIISNHADLGQIDQVFNKAEWFQLQDLERVLKVMTDMICEGEASNLYLFGETRVSRVRVPTTEDCRKKSTRNWSTAPDRMSLRSS